MPRVVLDPNVLVSVLIAPGGASAQLLVELRAGAFELVTSPQLLAELADVLQRPKFRAYVTEDEAAAYVELIRRESAVMEDADVQGTEVSEDPGDDYLIALARSAPAHALVSADPHLTRLGSALPILTPRQFLDSLPALPGE